MDTHPEPSISSIWHREPYARSRRPWVSAFLTLAAIALIIVGSLGPWLTISYGPEWAIETEQIRGVNTDGVFSFFFGGIAAILHVSAFEQPPQDHRLPHAVPLVTQRRVTLRSARCVHWFRKWLAQFAGLVIRFTITRGVEKGKRGMPLRRDGDRIEEIESFDDWVHDRLEEAIARGEFDNLPHKGKPIRIESNPFQPELDLAFSRLKNAGMAPAWIELDREIRAMHETLQAWLDATADRLAAEANQILALEEAGAPSPQVTTGPWHHRWWPFRLFAVTEGEEAEQDPAAEWRRWDWQRRVAREQYLERAAQLDTKIDLFNNSVPRDLWHLEKRRFQPARAADRFDAAIPPRDRQARPATYGLPT